MSEPSAAALPIGTVERETGLSKDVLRVWERRYGFPQPQRDANGDRIYPADQIERLRLIKHLMDNGKRPGKIVGLPLPKLQALLTTAAAPPPADGEVDALLALLRDGDPQATSHYLQHQLARHGLKHFVTDTLVTTNDAVGHAWMRGDISVYQEHFYTEQVQTVLRQALHSLPAAQQRPRVILTTLPNELHSLGLLMVQAVLLLEGAEVRSFGTQMPLTEIVAAVAAHEADVVALSFSAAFPPGHAYDSLVSLRELLPTRVQIWGGGAGLRGLSRQPAQVRVLDPLADLVDALRDWRQQHQETEQ